jgi:hypothetical protein
MSVVTEYRLNAYLLLYPLQPHSLHLYSPNNLVNLIEDSNKLRLLDLLILPILEQEGHLEVSG